ncbi:MAG: DUF3179 domain-containing protein [Halobacteriota archaeon]
MKTCLSRRRAIALVGTSVLAGCLGTPTQSADTATESDSSGPPVAADRLYVPYELSELETRSVSGGPGQDGIPSIDDPNFVPGSESSLTPDAPVFGVVRGDDVRAYPQHVLVFHEIVNDVLDGDPVAVTYCPLTGTAQGFERGSTTFGVSGDLVNSNLIMYDRGSESRWPQILSTAISGPLEGKSLREFPVTWTTWGRWREAHPETELLTDDTGYQRRYGNDPYGSYAPESGYYSSDNTMFRPLAETDAVHKKRVVIGHRSTVGTIAFDKQTLLDRRVLSGSIGHREFTAVADDRLETGYVYRTTGATVEPIGDTEYRVDGASFGPEELPFDRVLAFDGMHFAWYGFYPDVTYVN